MWMGMCVDMGIDMCSMCIDMWVDMCMDGRVYRHVRRTNYAIDVWMDTSVDMCSMCVDI